MPEKPEENEHMFLHDWIRDNGNEHGAACMELGFRQGKITGEAEGIIRGQMLRWEELIRLNYSEGMPVSQIAEFMHTDETVIRRMFPAVNSQKQESN